MKRAIWALLPFILFAAGCQTSSEVKKDEHANHNVNTETKANSPENFTADFKTNPAEVKAGEKTELSFTVKNARGEIVKDLQIVHEKLIHLLIVSRDLAEFYHEHPEQQSDGSFKVPFTFKNGGSFKLYADFTPKDSAQNVKSFDLNVTGSTRASAEIKADEKLEKTVDDLFVTLKPESDIAAGKELMLDFQVFDAATKKPVTDLQNYLGEKAHFVVISQDLKEFVHAHPLSRGQETHNHNAGEKHENHPTAGDSGSIVSAHLAFPGAGLYKIFAQFQRGGKVTTVPFVVNVKESAGKPNAAKSAEIPQDAFKVTISKEGFVPKQGSFTKGSFEKIAFYRTDGENCGDEVIISSLNVKKKLPVGEVVLVDLPLGFSGDLEFACGMNMYKGKIVVQ